MKKSVDSIRIAEKNESQQKELESMLWQLFFANVWRCLITGSRHSVVNSSQCKHLFPVSGKMLIYPFMYSSYTKNGVFEVLNWKVGRNPITKPVRTVRSVGVNQFLLGSVLNRSDFAVLSVKSMLSFSQIGWCDLTTKRSLRLFDEAWIILNILSPLLISISSSRRRRHLSRNEAILARASLTKKFQMAWTYFY